MSRERGRGKLRREGKYLFAEGANPPNCFRRSRQVMNRGYASPDYRILKVAEKAPFRVPAAVNAPEQPGVVGLLS